MCACQGIRRASTNVGRRCAGGCGLARLMVGPTLRRRTRWLPTGARQDPIEIRTAACPERPKSGHSDRIRGSNQDGGVLIPVCPLAGVPLRRLAAYLWMLGDDLLYSDAPGDRELAVIANAEGRGGEPQEPLVGGVALLGPVQALGGVRADLLARLPRPADASGD